MSKAKKRRERENMLYYLQVKAARLKAENEALSRKATALQDSLDKKHALLAAVIREHAQVRSAQREGEGVFSVQFQITPDMCRAYRIDSGALRDILSRQIERALYDRGREQWGSFLSDALGETRR